MTDSLIDAEQLAQSYSVEELAATAENYFARVTDWTYLLSKPFGSAIEAPVMLAHFGAMVAALRLEPGLRILDFGAGPCWTSHMLTQLGCEVLACDVSPTALAMGRRRFELQPPIGERPAPAFMVFDGRRIELDDESVDRISCMDAFHHVPNWAEVLAEFRRVLRPGGYAVLAEGGPNHSREQQSQDEMRRFTVVERDIVVEDLARLADEAGFGETSVAIYSGLPWLVPADRFEAELAAGEIAAKATRHFLANHRLIVLTKPGRAAMTSRSAAGLKASLRVEMLSSTRARAEIINTGLSTWLGNDVLVGAVNLGVHLFDLDGRDLDFDFQRVPIPRNATNVVEPTERVEFEFDLLPVSIERYQLEFDLVSEGVSWFKDVGSQSCVVEIRNS